MTSIAISDQLYRDAEQSAKLSNISLRKFVEQALSMAVARTRHRKPEYKLISTDKLPQEVRDIIGIASAGHTGT